MRDNAKGGALGELPVLLIVCGFLQGASVGRTLFFVFLGKL